MSIMALRAYKCGLPFGPNKNDAPLIRDIHWKQHEYYNNLVSIERARRQYFSSLRDRQIPAPVFNRLVEDVRLYEEKLKALEEKATEERALTGKRTNDTASSKSIKDARRELKKAKDALRAAKKAVAVPKSQQKSSTRERTI